ncbi:ubiquitin carboxyl-terminal hydrolase CYLD [Scleropages formosus]|uniref:ubiquitinyl hydrolase 1 n=1 Tax=Scleropages formosus TaxID=113540 RepID=A0A8C9SKD3_SCLFO|nr:ubiquitin carboxyl-terminal hydrolase CYLD-like [Scleropages formosus]
MEGAEERQRRYVVVAKGRARYGIRGIPLGSVGRVEAEAASSASGTQRAELAVRILKSSAQGVVTVRRGDVLFLSLRQTQLLLFVTPERQRLKLLEDAVRFAAIGELGAGDLVVVRRNKSRHTGLVKSLVELRHRDSAVDLLMLGFEVELLDSSQQKGAGKTPPPPVYSAGDIIEVPSRCLATSRDHVSNGPAEGTGKAVSRFSSLPNLGPHCAAGVGGRASFSSAGPLEVGSVVEVTTEGGVLVYGVVRWIGVPKGRKGNWVGVELDYEVGGCTDGTFGSRRYFTCGGNRAVFVPLGSCRPDSRFQSLPSLVAEIPQHEESSPDTSMEGEEEEFAPPIPESEAVSLLEGRMRGIQGYFNSCYLDVTLFSLFSSSTVLDAAFQDAASRGGSAARILHRDIVNKLRRQGFVPAENVMNFRRQLGCDSFMTEEKDPEEFVTVLFKQVLGMKPLLKIRSHSGCTQEAFTFPLILDKEQVGPVPTVQQLLETSFQSCDLKFEEVPSCLMIQMPRFGKRYKMFPQIVPTTELDVTDLLHDSLRECFICGRLACTECPACLSDRKLQPGRVKQYCSTCSVQVHSHPLRQGHQVRVLPAPRTEAEGAPLPRQRLQLLAVLCIQTSHYVAFVKHGPGARSWLFFDSMADCCGNGQKSFSVPEVRACPELGDFLARSEEDMATADVASAGEHVRRLLCDSYMCLYQRGHVGETDSIATATARFLTCRTHSEQSESSLV